MLSQTDHVDDDHELAAEQEYAGPGWYVYDMNGLVAGPFDTDGEAEWWIGKSFRV